MGYGFGAFAGGLAQGIQSGMQLHLAKEESDRRGEESRLRQSVTSNEESRRADEFKQKKADQQALKDYATEIGKNAERIGKDETEYSIPGMTDGFKTTDKDTADTLAGMASDARNPGGAGGAPSSVVVPQVTSRRYTQQDFDFDRLKLAGRLGLGQQADQAAAQVLANRQAEAIRKAGLAGEYTPIAREFNVIGTDQHMIGGTNPSTGKYHIGVFNADGSMATDKAGNPMGRVFDNQEHAVATLAAMADPKTLAQMYMSGARNESAMERLVASNLMRSEKGYGAGGGKSGGGKEDKNPYGWLSYDDFVTKAMPKDPTTGATHPGANNGFEAYRALLLQNPKTLGASEQGNATAINIASRLGTGQLKPYAEMQPDGIWSSQVQHGAAKFNIQQGIEPTGDSGQSALVLPPKEKVVAMDRAWLANLGTSQEGQKIYRQAAALAQNSVAFEQTRMVVKQGFATTPERMLWAAADKIRRLNGEPADKPAPPQGKSTSILKPQIDFTPTPGAGTVGRNNSFLSFR